MNTTTRQLIGTILPRVIVPLWITSGAMFKLVQATPRNLPKETLFNYGVQVLAPYPLLATLLALEFFAIAVMVFVPKLARAMAIFMLSCFCLILIGEMILGNLESCGCFGKVPVPPWATLIVDAALLLGVILFKPAKAELSRGGLIAAALFSIVGAAVSYKVILDAGRAPVTIPTGGNQGDGGQVPDGGTTPPPVADPTSQLPIPGVWYIDDIDAWIGKPWRELDLFRIMKEKPEGLDSGKYYVVFYSRTCDHCEEMFYEFEFDPEFAAQVIAIEVPESKTLMTSPNGWVMPDTDVTHMQLPVGCDWILSTPVALRIVDGKVDCANEGDHVECLEMPE